MRSGGVGVGWDGSTKQQLEKRGRRRGKGVEDGDGAKEGRDRLAE